MTVDERARHALHVKLEETLGPEVTGTLMELLPPVGWADVATRHDLDALGHRMGARMSDLRTELHDGLAAVRTEFRTEVADVRSEIGGLRTELRTEVAGVRTEMADLSAALLDQMASGQRLLLFGMLTAMFSLAGLVWAAATVAA